MTSRGGEILPQKALESQDFLLFRTRSGAHYLYDAPTNTVHPWPYQTSFDLLNGIYDQDRWNPTISELADDLPELANYISLWRNKTGAFRSSSRIQHASLPIRSSLPNGQWGPAFYSNLVLIVTEACNQRCHYCVYSGTYLGYREHGSSKLTWEMAKKAVDYFLELNSKAPFKAMPDRNINIWFHGGEPLIEFDLIKRVIQYAQSKVEDHYTLNFGMGTNLTLLTSQHLDFFRRNNVFLQVSLDGPEEDHDRYRRFADGRPSFKGVIKNLEMIRLIDAKYFKERVNLSVTLNGNSRLQKIRSFFEKNADCLPDIRILNFIKDMKTGCFHQKYPYSQEVFEREYDQIISSYLEAKRLGHSFKEGEFLYRFIEEGIMKFHQPLHSIGIATKDSYTGTCFPGRRIALAPNGFYYTCERIDYGYPIGNVETGLNEQMIVYLLKSYSEALPDCDRCWARNLCSICFAAVAVDKKFDFSSQCRATRNEIVGGLMLLYSMLEDNPSALKNIPIDNAEVAEILEDGGSIL